MQKSYQFLNTNKTDRFTTIFWYGTVMQMRSTHAEQSALIIKGELI